MIHGGVELDAMLEVPEQAGLVETYVNGGGKDAMRWTADGERVARQMAMSSDDERGALLAALLEAARDGA